MLKNHSIYFKEDSNMRKNEMLTMGRKAETIYTTQKKNQAMDKTNKVECTFQHRRISFENLIRKLSNCNKRLCYVYINGISMPVSHA